MSPADFDHINRLRALATVLGRIDVCRSPAHQQVTSPSSVTPSAHIHHTPRDSGRRACNLLGLDTPHHSGQRDRNLYVTSSQRARNLLSLSRVSLSAPRCTPPQRDCPVRYAERHGATIAFVDNCLWRHGCADNYRLRQTVGRESSPRKVSTQRAATQLDARRLSTIVVHVTRHLSTHPHIHATKAPRLTTVCGVMDKCLRHNCCALHRVATLRRTQRAMR